MQLTNKVYDICKYIVMIILPALTTLYVGVSGVLATNGLPSLPYPEVVTGISALLCTFLGTVLQISSKSYKGEGTLTVNTDKDADEDRYKLNINSDIDNLENRKTFVLNVEPKTTENN